MAEMFMVIRAADRLAYEVATVILRGSLGVRSRVSGALEDYLEIGSVDGPKTVPEWIKQYEAAQAARGTS